MSCELSRQCEWIFLHLILTLPARRDDSDRREKGGAGPGLRESYELVPLQYNHTGLMLGLFGRCLCGRREQE